jgi:hypothetical protein
MPSTATKIYNPDEITITLDGTLLEGFADGEFVTIEETSPRITSVSGSDGEVAVSKHMDRRATITVKLLATSDSNDKLDELMAMNEAGPGLPGIKPVFIRDRQGRSIHEADHAWVMEAPAVAFDRSAGSREWKIEVARLRNTIRGSNAIA